MKKYNKYIGPAVVITTIAVLLFAFGFAFGGGIEMLRGFPTVAGFGETEVTQTIPEYQHYKSYTVVLELNGEYHSVELSDKTKFTLDP